MKQPGRVKQNPTLESDAGARVSPPGLLGHDRLLADILLRPRRGYISYLCRLLKLVVSSKTVTLFWVASRFGLFNTSLSH